MKGESRIVDVLGHCEGHGKWDRNGDIAPSSTLALSLAFLKVRFIPEVLTLDERRIFLDKIWPDNMKLITCYSPDPLIKNFCIWLRADISSSDEDIWGLGCKISLFWWLCHKKIESSGIHYIWLHIILVSSWNKDILSPGLRLLEITRNKPRT